MSDRIGYVIRNTFNGSYLMGADNNNHLDTYSRYWGSYKNAKVFQNEEYANKIAQSCEFATVEKVRVENVR